MKQIAALAALAVLSAVNVHALEFGTTGTVGMGGAGVARPPAGLESYWNPAALAFKKGQNSFILDVQAKAKVRGGLADSLERLNEVGGIQASPPPSTGSQSDMNDWMQGGFADGLRPVGIMESMADNGGAFISAGANVVLGQSVSNWAFGYYGSVYSSVFAAPDLVNILPDMGDGTPAGVRVLGMDTLPYLTGAGSHVGSNIFFSAQQRQGAADALMAAGLSTQQAENLISGVDYRLGSSNEGKVTPEEATSAIVDAAALILNGGGGLIDNNATAVVGHALFLNEVPLSYGRAINLGKYGTLGVGSTTKVMFGRVYSNTIVAYNTEIEDVYEKLDDEYKDTVSWGLDLGGIWKYEKLSIGLTAKNLNSPAFKLFEGGKIRLKPQVRTGVDYEALSWLRVAADVDLTKNDGLQGETESQVLGGGVEVTPVSFASLRFGCYKNLATSDDPVLTGGLSLGPKAVSLSINGAYGLGKTTYDGEEYPSEAQLQAALNINF